MEPEYDPAPAALALASWRREIHSLYDQVRRQQDPKKAHATWRGQRDHMYRTHSQSPLLADDPLRGTGLPYWPYDPKLRWTLPLKPSATDVNREIDLGDDGVTRLHLIGWVELPQPNEARLGVWWLDQYAGGLFVPVRDGTAGQTSYGGGRYLLDSAKGADLGGSTDELVVDLNFLYHASCRYDPRWTCPLAPDENAIDLPIQAGERLDFPHSGMRRTGTDA